MMLTPRVLLVLLGGDGGAVRIESYYIQGKRSATELDAAQLELN